MIIVLKLFILLVLFIIISKSADLTLKGVNSISKDIGIPVIFSGLILGFFTSLPEFFIGISSTINNISQASYGNLLGGIIVLFGLLTGLTVILNREIRIKNFFRVKDFILIIIFLLLPIITAFIGYGQISQAEGLMIIFAYIIVAIAIFSKDVTKKALVFKFFPHHRKMFFSIFLGVIGVVISAKFIVDVVQDITNHYHLSAFFIGLIVFSLGTNLPELVLMVRAWQKKVKELSLGNLIGSAVTNILIIGIISFLKPIPVDISCSFLVFIFFFLLISISFVVFALTGKRFNYKEGLILLGAYIIFIITQIFINKI